MDLFSLKGKKAIVTGGAQGIGYAISESLVEAGAEVILIDLSDKVEKSAQILSQSGMVHGIRGNLMDRKERRIVFDKAMAMLNGQLDILVNNAGIQRRGCILDFSDEDWDDVIEVNLNAVFSLCKYAGHYMVNQKKGKIINIASINSYMGGTNASAYSATKGAVVQLTKAISNEWSKYNINANCIAPGFIETSLTKDMVADPEVYQFKLKRIPMGRWGKPSDLKGVVQFLASDASDYICGVTIPVDGGYLSK